MFQAQPNSPTRCPQNLPYIRTIPFGSSSTGLVYLQLHYVFDIELLDLKMALKFDCQIEIRLQHMFNYKKIASKIKWLKLPEAGKYQFRAPEF